MATTTEQVTLTVQRRAGTGTRPTRRLRRSGLVPGVVYGKAVGPLPVTVDRKGLVHLLRSKTGEHTLVTLRLADDPGWSQAALVQMVQHDPVDGHVLHVDFHAIALTERIRVRVPVILKGEPIGVKQEGGILEHFLRDVEVECLPTEIPAGVAFDVSGLTVGQTVHVSDLAAPPNAGLVSDPTGVIASIQMPKAEQPTEEAAAVAEPEVIRERKAEEAGPAAEEAGAESPKKDSKS